MGARRTVQEKKKGRSRDPFAMVPFKWMDLPAWAHLSGNAVKLLLHMIRLSGGNNGATNARGELFLSERSAAEAIGVARNTASAALDLLVEAGWARPVQKGHFHVKAGEREMRSTVWRLTFQPHPQSRRGPTSDFLDWKPGKEKSRAQKLNGSGSKIGPVADNPPNSGAKTEPVPQSALSADENSGLSEIEPHIDIARGKRRDDAIVPAVLPSLRELVRARWHALDRPSRVRLAKFSGLSLDELHAFVTGRFIPSIGKQMALRSAMKEAA